MSGSRAREATDRHAAASPWHSGVTKPEIATQWPLNPGTSPL